MEKLTNPIQKKAGCIMQNAMHHTTTNPSINPLNSSPMIQLADMDLLAIKSQIEETLLQLNNEYSRMLIHHTTQYTSQEYPGEAYLMILGFSFKPAFNNDDDYYQAINDARDTAISCINNFLDTAEQSIELITPTSTDHAIWVSTDGDRLTLDAADDSLILTLYLSGQY